MIIYLYGPDSYRRSKKLKEILDRYKSKHGSVDISVFDLEEDEENWIKAKNALSQPSMFVKTKTAVIKNSNKVERAEWLKVLKSLFESKDVFVIISDPKPPKKKFKPILDGVFMSENFEDLEGEKLEKFVRRELKKRNVKLAPPAFNFLISYLSSSELRSVLAVNEIEKIYLAKFPNPVSLDDLRSIIIWKARNVLYQEIRNVLYAENIPQTLSRLESLFMRAEEPMRIFNSAVYQLRGEDVVEFAGLDVMNKSGRMEPRESFLYFVFNKIIPGI